jgi:endogenous inhibitor of DNA gyrase (YacG/DUF329 family)
MSAITPPPGRRGPIVRCPTCGGDSRFEPANAWRPFCSERCKSVDLGAWATERYRVAEQARPDADTEGDGGPQTAGPH